MGGLLVLWDIDGTLLNAGGVGGNLYGLVFSSMFGRPCEKLAPMAGRTDRAIILDTLELAGIPEPRRYVDRFIEGLRAHAPLVLRAARQHARALPGAAEAIAAISAVARGSAPMASAAARTASAGNGPVGNTAGGSAVPGGPPASPAVPGLTLLPGYAQAAVPGIPGPAVSAGAFIAAATTPFGAPAVPLAAAAAPGAGTLPVATAADRSAPLPVTAPAAAARLGRWPARVYQSVLTGNVRSLAEVKLDAVGLRSPLDLCIGAYGDDHEVRAELVHLARRRATAVYGSSAGDFGGHTTVVVGDTPLDIEAALAAGARAVGVATGSRSADDLRAAGAHAVLPDLTDTAVVLAALLP